MCTSSERSECKDAGTATLQEKAKLPLQKRVATFKNSYSL